jgi:hypothetical protein
MGREKHVLNRCGARGNLCVEGGSGRRLNGDDDINGRAEELGGFVHTQRQIRGGAGGNDAPVKGGNEDLSGRLPGLSGKYAEPPRVRVMVVRRVEGRVENNLDLRSQWTNGGEK